jgi:putative tryptophan/tyrosine transport system substrate-binding protein
LALPDPFIYSRETAQSILLTSYRYQKPVFGYSQSYVQAGALAGVYTNAKHLAKQAAEIAIQSQQAIGGLPPPQAPKYFSVMINRQVGRSLKIPLMDEETIHKKMVETEAMR